MVPELHGTASVKEKYTFFTLGRRFCSLSLSEKGLFLSCSLFLLASFTFVELCRIVMGCWFRLKSSERLGDRHLANRVAVDVAADGEDPVADMAVALAVVTVEVEAVAVAATGVEVGDMNSPRGVRNSRALTAKVSAPVCLAIRCFFSFRISRGVFLLKLFLFLGSFYVFHSKIEEWKKNWEEKFFSFSFPCLGTEIPKTWTGFLDIFSGDCNGSFMLCRETFSFFP